MITPIMRQKIVDSLPEEARELYLKIENAADDGVGDTYLTAEEADCLRRLFQHVMSMNLRIEEYLSAGESSD